MNETLTNQEKDFRNLIGQFINHSEIRDKMIYEIDEILDRIKRNRRPIVEAKTDTSPDRPERPDEDVITQLGDIVRRMDLANEKTGAIIQRLNELI